MAIFPGIREIRESIGQGNREVLDIPAEYTSGPGDDHFFMARALKLAEKGINTTHPNPRVGCVITQNGVVVGEGYHQVTDEPHAEVHALRQAGKYARGATLYVNLEPCCHHGRTPPCTDAIIKAGLARVVIAIEDRSPLVNRKGISALRNAGIEVHTGVNQKWATRLNRGFINRVTRGVPWVTLKIAASLDGRTAMANGESQWITSEEARQDAHRLRASSSAIITGIGTVLRDDPQMTARTDDVSRQPLRVILDRRLSTPEKSRILESEGDVLIMTSPEHVAEGEIYRQKNVEVIGCPLRHGSLDLTAAMRELGSREINSLMLEAGSRLCGSMLAARLVDEMVIYLAPNLLGADARGMFEIPGLESIQDKHCFHFSDVRQVGRDLKLTLQRETV